MDVSAFYNIMLKNLEKLTTNIELLISINRTRKNQLASLNKKFHFLEEENKKNQHIIDNLKIENTLLSTESNMMREKFTQTQKQLSKILETLST